MSDWNETFNISRGRYARPSEMMQEDMGLCVTNNRTMAISMQDPCCEPFTHYCEAEGYQWFEYPHDIEDDD